jgi:hypothetical protein
MKINEKLTRIIQGRTIQMVMKEEGLVVMFFDDRSTLRVKVVGGPALHVLEDGKIESAREDGSELTLVTEDSRALTLRLAESGSSVIVKDKDDCVKYSG